MIDNGWMNLLIEKHLQYRTKMGVHFSSDTTAWHKPLAVDALALWIVATTLGDIPLVLKLDLSTGSHTATTV